MLGAGIGVLDSGPTVSSPTPTHWTLPQVHGLDLFGDLRGRLCEPRTHTRSQNMAEP